MLNEIEPLADAFVHQSVAAAKNRIRAQKAAQDNDAAKNLFLAMAMGQEIQAKKALMLLRGRIGSTEENLAEALQETRELVVETLPWTVLAQAEGDRAAGALLVQMARALASHLAQQSLPANAQTKFYVCGVCGHVHSGSEPGRCPVCHALPEKFIDVDA
jgi:rubrerythrin